MTGRLFSAALLDALCGEARQAARRRVHHCIHTHNEALVHRLFVAMQPDSYVAPHRHLASHKTETLLLLRGRMGYLEFDDKGALHRQEVLDPAQGQVAVDIPCGTWHSVVALSEDCVFFEIKAGPYAPLSAEERASWAPAEGDAGAQAFLQRWQAALAASA